MKVIIAIDNIQFDPEDPVTQAMKAENIVYYICLDTTCVGCCDPAAQSVECEFDIDAESLNDTNSVVRIIAKDGNSDQDPNKQTKIGFISFNTNQYFGQMPKENFGRTTSQWITLFEEADDDQFDGDFGVDDDEMPMINVKVNGRPDE